jgi:tetratricopeptide (TPR) repeat protein
MKTRFVPLAFALLGAACCSAQQPGLAGWKQLLLEKKDPKAARALCSGFVDSKVLTEQVEAEKCLSNVALYGANALHLENDQSGHPDMYDEYIPEAIDEALVHLSRALKLAPGDLSIHQGRLHVLEISRRYSDMAAALDESCNLYHGPEVPSAWLDYASELNDLHAYEPALQFMIVLDKYYSNSPDILGNIGAFLSLLKRDKDAISYLKRAVDLAPNDPINTWDLGREYDYIDETALADQWYKKGISLMTDAAQIKQSRCIYATFVEKKLKDTPRACKLQNEDCDPDKRTACAAPTSTPDKNE